MGEWLLSAFYIPNLKDGFLTRGQVLPESILQQKWFFDLWTGLENRTTFNRTIVAAVR